MTKTTAKIPRSVTWPLWLGALALLGFMISAAMWLTYAPLNTSIKLSGSLISALPDYRLQHPFGGQISWVGIRPQQNVRKGQILLRLNFDAEREALKETKRQIGQQVAENKLINAVLAHDTIKSDQDASVSSVARLLQTESRANHLQVNALRDTAISLTHQISGARAEISLIQQQLSLLQEQEKSQEQLRARALVRKSEVQEITKQILTLAGQQERRRNDVTALIQQRLEADAQAHRLEVEFRAKLLQRLSKNEVNLSRLRTEEARLSGIVETEIIRSPINGHVHSLPFDTELAYAPRGETLVTLAQRLEAPRLRLNIPVSSVDQVRSGMEGQLVLSSLPQRGLPPVYVKITSISPSAQRNREGSVIGFSAEAEFIGDGLSAVLKVLDEVRLSADMPVNVTLTGRKMTFAEYLLPPISSFVSNAFQD